MKKILTIILVLASVVSFGQAKHKGKYGVYSFEDTVYFKNVPYSASASIVHLGIDTLVTSPTFGKLVRKTAGGGISTNIYNSDGTLDGFRTVTGGDSSLTFTFNGRDSSGLRITSNATNAVSNRQKLFEVALSGANSNSNQTTYSAHITNTHSGTSSTNYGLWGESSGGTDNRGIAGIAITAGGTTNIGGIFSAGNATNNYGLLVNAGKVGILTLTPTMQFQIAAGAFVVAKGGTVAAANDLTLNQANSMHISGATQINAITSTGWVAGAEVLLIFDSNPVVKNNTAGGAGTAPILLAGGADFNATANDVLRLFWDGANWYEVSRSVN